MRHVITALAILAAWPGDAQAQIVRPMAGSAVTQGATLVADTIYFPGAGSAVVAEGNVEIFWNGERVQAQRITYDQVYDTLDIEGPITITQTDGTVLTGTAAQLSRDFNAGVIQGARFLIADNLQIAATELNRVDGRYNQLTKAVASTCQVCANNPTPAWQIRAEKIVHDQQERQLYFTNAWFDLAGVPIAYFPKLRIPDPSQTRARGFLLPELRNSTTLGTGIRIPYFLPIGDHSDLLLAPYLSSRTRTLEARYRREFTFGSVALEGAVSRDTLTTHSARAYLFADAQVNLPADFKLLVDLNLVSDADYLLEYGYSDADRLPTRAEITRTRRDEYISVSAQKWRSLRAPEIAHEDTLATTLGLATYERRFFPAGIGGEARFVFDLEGHERQANQAEALALAAACTANSAPECTGRDVIRAGAVANWRRDWIGSQGAVFAIEGQVDTSIYQITQDANFATSVSHVTPTAAVELRLPLTRETASGARHFLEPVMQLAWTDTVGTNVPNDDSQLVDFDEGNLLSLSRFPGSDQIESGWRSTLGLNWSRLGQEGQQYSATLGRVLRLEDLGQFGRASGLDGSVSDWLLASQVKTENLTVTNRSLFDNHFNFAKSETQLAWHSNRLTSGGSYIWVVDDPAEGRTGNTSELNLWSNYQMSDNWVARANGRYDANINEPIDAGLGLTYNTECLRVDFSVSHRFLTSTNVSASTDYGVNVSLNGFGGASGRSSKHCATQG